MTIQIANLPVRSDDGRSLSRHSVECQSAILGVQSIETRMVDGSTWNAVLSNFSDISFEQCSTFAVTAWDKARAKFHVVARKGEIIAGACVVTFALPIVGRGVAYIRHGPVWRRRGKKPNTADYIDTVSALVAEYGCRQGHGIVIIPRPNPAANSIETAGLRDLGFRVARPILDPDRYLVDVTLEEEAQLASLDQKWRYNLRAALRNGIEIAEAVTTADRKVFAALHGAMTDRKKFEEFHSIDVILDVVGRMPESLRPKVFLAYQRGEPIAGAVIGVHGDTAYYLFGATNARALPLNAGYALHWSIVQRLRGSAVNWYDLGGTACSGGLRQFKKGLVGKRGAILTSEEYIYAPDLSARLATSAVLGIRGIRRAAKNSLGSLKY